MDFSGCPDDDSLGPAVQGCRGDFDFTLKFEKIFFSIIPAAVFLAASLPRVVYLIRRTTIVGGTALKILKLVGRPPFRRLPRSPLTNCSASFR